MARNAKLTSSREDYLETIYNLIREKRFARVTDIASRLGVKKSSVTSAIKNLTGQGLVNHEKYGSVKLTETGLRRAREIIRRHQTLRAFFIRIGILPRKAEDAACRMEHAMPPEVIARLGKLEEFIENCPRAGEDWLSAFSEYCENSEGEISSSACKGCVSKLSKRLSRE